MHQTLHDRAIAETIESFERKILAHRNAIIDRAHARATFYVGWPKFNLYLDAQRHSRGALHAAGFDRAQANILAARTVNANGDAAVAITAFSAHQQAICTLRKLILSLGK